VLHRELEAGALALCIVLGAWAGHARAQGFSSTSPVIAILDGELSFTYGLSAEDSAPYLHVPAGKELRRERGGLELVAAVPFPSR
jgi:hypothetical protein